MNVCVGLSHILVRKTCDSLEVVQQEGNTVHTYVVASVCMCTYEGRPAQDYLTSEEQKHQTNDVMVRKM
jgi:hypothetical protein